MMRYLKLILFFVLPVFADWENDDDDCVQYQEIPYQISYGGMTIECYWGCGDVEDGFFMNEIADVMGRTIRSVMRTCRPLDLAYDSDSMMEEGPWILDEANCRIFNWPLTQGFYSEDYPEEVVSFATYPQFLQVASLLRRDIRFYYLDMYRQQLNVYKSVLPELKRRQSQGKYECVEFDTNGKLNFSGEYDSFNLPINKFIKDLKYNIQRIENGLGEFYLQDYEEKKEVVEKAIQDIESLFRRQFTWCLTNHQPEGIAFHSALENFIEGDFDRAIEQIRWLIEVAENHALDNDLLSKLYLLKGQIQSEFCLYADAIIALTTAIQKTPSKKEIYFERAGAYFELGEFDKAIEDYLTSGYRSSFSENPTLLGLGIGAGILEGGAASLVDFIPSMLSTARGLGSGLWAFSKDPIQVSQDFAVAAIQCIDYLRSRHVAGMIQDMVPELKELVQNYDTLGDLQKGRLIGQVIGKYGMDILLAKYATTGVKAYRDLKKANQLMTLEALASAESRQIILAEAGKRWAMREQTLSNGVLKFHEGKQGKHIEGHPNYKDLKKRGEHPSIFKHPDPDRLLREHAGTGIKNVGDIPGMPGYKEIVDFGEFIGYSVNEKTGKKLATTRGKIHYGKDGVHIVPTAPREK